MTLERLICSVNIDATDEDGGGGGQDHSQVKSRSRSGLLARLKAVRLTCMPSYSIHWIRGMYLHFTSLLML